MKKEKLDLLPVIFSEWGYYIQNNKIYNSKNKEIGYEVKDKKEIVKRVCFYKDSKNKIIYTYNEVLAWNKGMFDNVINPESVFIDNNLNYINVKKRFEENRVIPSKEKHLKGILEYLNTEKSIKKITEELNIDRVLLRKNIKQYCKENEIEIPKYKVKGRFYY